MKAGNPTESIPKQKGRGGWVLFDLACSHRLLGEKVRPRRYFFLVFWKGEREIQT
jgi:hypothetical protein